jgi:glycosyltransferase involved in cell wall biosynthesis
MAVYNGEKHLQKAVDSILNQTFKDFEFIIVNDGSTDSTPQLLASYAQKDHRIALIDNEKNLKLIRSLNRGLEHARGKYIARMDADDISLPTRFEKQVAFLDSHLEVGLIGAFPYNIKDSGKIIRLRTMPITDVEIRWQHLFGNAFCHSSVMFRRKLLQKTGLYDLQALHAEDYDLFSKMGLHSGFQNLPEPLVHYRVTEASISFIHRDEQLINAGIIALREISRIVGKQFLDQDQVNTVRYWYRMRPDKIHREDFNLSFRLLQLYKSFATRYKGSPGLKAVRSSLGTRLAFVWLHTLSISTNHLRLLWKLLFFSPLSLWKVISADIISKHGFAKKIDAAIKNITAPGK